jgi:hypothetical protein
MENKKDFNKWRAFDTAKNDVEKLDDNSLYKIVTDVKDWYSRQHVA